MMGLYRLDGTTPVSCHNLLDWARWMQFADRKVAYDEVGEWTVSTVFLGLDHSWSGAEPTLFETMAFRGGSAREQRRCSTWIGAEWQHAEMLELIASRPKLELIETPRLLRPGQRGRLRSVQ